MSDHTGPDQTRARGLVQAVGRFFGRRKPMPSLVAGHTTVEITAETPEIYAPEEQAVIGLASDVGCVRSVNEDAVLVQRHTEGSARGVLAVVCDGMGGHAAGEVASRIAIDIIAKEWRSVADPADALRRAIQKANRAIAAVAATKWELAGMGTTCITLILREGMAWCAHVGDSRCYLLRGEQLFLMTEDHSAVMELVRKGELTADAAREHPDKNVISRALGSRHDVEVTVWPRPFRLRAGDRFLLCSDGLYDVVRDETMRAVMLHEAPQAACDRLISVARTNGAPDNVSAAIVALPGLVSTEVSS